MADAGMLNAAPIAGVVLPMPTPLVLPALVLPELPALPEPPGVGVGIGALLLERRGEVGCMG